MKFAVETWAPEYGIAVDDAQLGDTNDVVDVSAEVEAGKWAPITPTVADGPRDIAFVDGVQRTDARVWVTDGDAVRAGVCAVVAAGVVRCTDNEARVTGSKVARFMFAPRIDTATSIVAKHATYRYKPCLNDAPESIQLAIHAERNRLEVDFGALDDAELTVFDGPLRDRDAPDAVGYVKTQHVRYLPEREEGVLMALDTGQRTPLFHMSSGRGLSRFSWYLRLPGERSHPWAGIVRCELPAMEVPEAIAKADRVSGLLPQFASEPHKDGRAPQNLYPIAGLENDLRRLLGDQHLMERTLRIAAAREIASPVEDGGDDFDLLIEPAGDLVRAVCAAGAPMPIVGYELDGGDGWMVEAAWLEKRVDVVVDSGEERDQWLEANGWRRFDARTSPLSLAKELESDHGR